MPIFKIANHQFFKRWSQKMAYVLGFFAADGTMIRNNRGAHFIEFHITDKKLLYRIRSALGSNHKIGVRIRNRKWKIGYRLQIGSKELFDDLQKFGFKQNKSKNVRLPHIPARHISHYVRGYFDGDGNVYFKKHRVKDRRKKRWVFTTRFTSGSLKYLEDLHRLLLRTGLRKGFIVKKVGGYELIFSHRDGLALYGIMYDTISVAALCLPRKYRLFRRAIETLYPMRQ